MGKNNESRRGLFLALYLCASFVSLEIGHSVGHAQTKQGESLHSTNKITSSRVVSLELPGNAEKKLPMMTKNHQGDKCLKTQDPAQLVHLESHDQIMNNGHQAWKADNIYVIDFGLQTVINAQ